jgi:hypothetical protein
MRTRIVHAHNGSGLMSLFNNVVSCLEICDKVEVQWDPKKTPYVDANVDNLWDAIAEPIDICTKKDSAEIFTGYVKTYTGANAGLVYIRNDGWRERLNTCYNRVIIKECIFRIIDSEIGDKRLSDCVAILHRSSDSIATEQITKQNPSVESMIQAANYVDNKARVFVACDSVKSLLQFRKAFGSRLIAFTALGHSRIGGEIHHENKLGIEHVRAVLAQTIALSRCNYLIHGVSNIATSALYMSPNMQHTFVQTHPHLL